MFPIKCDDVPVKFPPITAAVVLLCTAAFFWGDLLRRFSAGFVPVDFMYALFHPTAREMGGLVIMLGTAFFMHAGAMHLLANMWYLWIFGSALEYELGAASFCGLYLGCGVVSMVVQALSSPLSTIPVVGASGAIAGVMGAFLVFLPWARILVWFPPVFFFRVWAILFLLLWFAIQYFSMRLSPSTTGGVAWWAHIGGFCAGLVAGLWLRRRKGSRPQRRPATKRSKAEKAP